MPIAQKAEPFPVSHFFFLLMLFLRKPWLTFLFRSALDVTFLMIQLLAVLPFLSFFLSGRNPTLLVRKFFAATSFFTSPCSGSPRYHSFCIVRGYSRLFSIFLAGSLIPEKNVSALCF